MAYQFDLWQFFGLGLTLAKWETVSGQFGGYLVVREEFRSH